MQIIFVYRKNTQQVIYVVGPDSADGKRVGPVIEKSLVRNPEWTVTIF
jgi:hypothetical protein